MENKLTKLESDISNNKIDIKELKALKLAHATDGLSLAEREGK